MQIQPSEFTMPGPEPLYIDKRQEALDMHNDQYCWSVLIQNMPGCFLCLHISVFHHWLHWSLALRRLLRSKFSQALSQTSKHVLSEDTVYSRIEDTVRWEGQGQNVSWKNTAESWKRMRGLENSVRTCGEKYSARQALKLHSKAAGVKQCQSCETHRTPLAKTQPRHPNQMLASQTKYTYSRYTIGLRGILPLQGYSNNGFIPSTQAETERQDTQTQTHTHTNTPTALVALQGCDLRTWIKSLQPIQSGDRLSRDERGHDKQSLSTPLQIKPPSSINPICISK